MTRASEKTFTTTVADGVNTTWDFDFAIWKKDDIDLFVTTPEGVETQIDPSLWDLTIATGDSVGGRVTYPLSGTPVASGNKVTVILDMEFYQEVDLQRGQGFNPETLESLFDKMVAYSQQLKAGLARAFQTPVASDLSPEALVQQIFNAAAQVSADKLTVDQAMSNLFSRWNPLQTTVEGQTDYTFIYPVNMTDKNALVYVGGIFQDPDKDYSFVNPTTVRFDPAPPAGQELRIITSTSASNPDLQSTINAALAVAIANGEAAIDQRKNEAIAEIDDVRPTSTPPILSGDSDADEGETVRIYIDNYITPTDDPYTNYEISVTGGSFGAIAQEVVTGKWYIPWTLPSGLSQNESHEISVYRRSRSQNPSSIVKHIILVKNVMLQDRTYTIDDSTGWDVQPVGDEIFAPATSIGIDNTYQIVSVRPEIVQTSGNLTLLSASTNSISCPEAVKQGGSLALTVDGSLIEAVADSVAGGSTTTESTADMWTDTTGGFDLNTTGEITIGTGSQDSIRTATPVSGDFEFNFNIAANAVSGGSTVGLFSVNGLGEFLPNTHTQTHTGMRPYLISGSIDNKRIQFSDYRAYPSSPETGGATPACTTNSIITISRVNGVVSYSYKDDAGAETYRYTFAAQFTDDIYLYVGMWSDVDVFNNVSLTSNAPYVVNISSSALTSAPSSAIKIEATLSVGVGIIGEYLGAEKTLTLGLGSTTTQTVVESSSSVLSEIYLIDGVHNNIIHNGNNIVVNSGVESETGGVYTTTLTHDAQPLAASTVAIPNRCNLIPTDYSYVIDGTNLKTTGDAVTVLDNPKIKRLAMSVNGSDVKFNSGKLYIKERV